MKKIYLFLFIIISNSLLSQNSRNQIDQKAYKLCSAFNGFSSVAEANTALIRILSTVGVSQNFVMKECSNVSNAAAIQVEGIRYIFYNPEWLSSINSNYSYGGMFTLAHEVGHHVNGHTVDAILVVNEIVNEKTLGEKRLQELQADEFAGFVLAKLGASLSQTTSVINDVTDDQNDTYSTHPSRSKRLLAIEKGYNKAINNNNITAASNSEENSYNNKSVLVFTDGSRWEGEIEIIKKTENVKSKDNIWYPVTTTSKRPIGQGIMYNIDGSVYKGTYFGGKRSGYGEMYYTNGSVYKGQWLNGQKSGRGELIESNGQKSILVNGESEANKFYKEGIEKFDLENYQGALLSFNKAIELDPQNNVLFYFRGQCKGELKDLAGALKDYDSCLKYENDPGYVYRLRSDVKFDLEDYKGALLDIEKYIDSAYFMEDDDKSRSYAFKGEIQRRLEKYNDAIGSFDLAIDSSGDNNDIGLVYYSRGLCKIDLQDYEGAIADFDIAELKNYKDSILYYWRAHAFYWKDDNSNAISNLDQAINLDSSDSAYYSLRADSKYNSNDKLGAQLDYTKALELNPEDGHSYRYRGLIKYYENDNNGALADLNKAILINNQDVDVLYDLANVKYELNDKIGQLQCYDKIIKLSITNSYSTEFMAKVYNSKSYYLVKINKYIEALPLVDKALKLDAEKGYIWDTRGEIMYNLGRYSEAIKDMTKAIELDVEEGHSYYFRGLAKIKLSNKMGGCEDLYKAVELGEEDAINSLKINCN
jgi:tetratricopeptide (TPR) repeat protein